MFTHISFVEGNPFLGCSVDGIVSCKCKSENHTKLIEIKCPYVLREKTPKDAAKQKFCILDEETSRWVVTPQCPYYCQIQGQMGLYGYSECDLVIYTNHGIHVSTAKFDQSFYDSMLKKLAKFHLKHLVPYLLTQLM